MSTARDSTELFGPLSKLHVQGGGSGWKLLDASKTLEQGIAAVSVLMRQEARSGIVLWIAPKLNFCRDRRLKAPSSGYSGTQVLIENYAPSRLLSSTWQCTHYFLSLLDLMLNKI